MRVLNKKTTSLYVWRNINIRKSRIMVFIVLFFLAVMLFVMNRFPYATVGLIMIPLAYILGVYTYMGYVKWSSGSGGEAVVLESLKTLDDSYCVISNVVVPPNKGDTDYIVVGPNGVFVIEAKNLGGEISCSGDVWSRRKVGRGGRPYQLEIGSPSNQVKRNAKVLKDFILEHQRKIFKDRVPHIWAHGVLVFTNNNVVLSLNKPTVNVLRVDELANFIVKEKKHVFSNEDVDGICSVILEYSG